MTGHFQSDGSVSGLMAPGKPHSREKMGNCFHSSRRLLLQGKCPEINKKEGKVWQVAVRDALEKIFESPLGFKEIKRVHPKGNQP